MTRIDLISREDMKTWLETHSDIHEFYNFLNLRYAGGNHITVKKYMAKNDLLDIFADFKKRVLLNSHKKINSKYSKTPEEILSQNSNVSRRCLKNYLMKVKEYKCDICNLNGEWNGKPITLQIHHINGIYNDNRIQNLQFLCPNCHSQTDNYRGKNIKQKKSTSKTQMANENLKKERWNIIQNCNIDFKKSGWVKEISILFGVAKNKGSKYIKKNYPDFYKTCFTRKSS